MNYQAIVVVLALVVFGQARADLVNSSAQVLSNLNYASLIGTPLQAVVYAQALAAKATTQFIEDVGFSQVASKENPGQTVNQVNMVAFNYYAYTNNSKVYLSMQVPFLFMVPIPFLQIDLVTLDLNIQLTSVEKTKFNAEASESWSVSGSYGTGCGWWSCDEQTNYNAGVSSQARTESASTITSEFSLAVHVQGSQAPMPQGMTRIQELFATIVAQGLQEI